MAASYFEQQLGMYSAYHRDHRNRATHFIGIPSIVFSILVLAALVRFPLFGAEISLAWIGAIVAVIGWIALDRTVGIAMIVPMAIFLAIAEWIARTYGVTSGWIVFAIFFVGGWAFQLVGHAWEGRRPALMDNLFQAFIGPMFIMVEVLMAIGIKRDLKSIIESAGPAAR